jgi:hypothetical protein
MTSKNKLKEELLSLALNAAFFGAWFLAFLVIKDLILAEYSIGPTGVTAALVAALVVAKVVLLLEHVELGSVVQSRPAWVEVALRTALYAIGALVVMLLEKSFEARHEAGGFVNALAGVLHHRDIPHVVANTLSVTGALLLFNAKSVVQRHLGSGALFRMFTQPMPSRLRMKRF